MFLEIVTAHGNSIPKMFTIQSERQKCQAHFIRGLLAPRDNFRGIVWVDGIASGIVVVRFKIDVRTRGQFQRRLEFVAGLPIEIPIFNMHERNCCPVRQRRRDFHFLAQQVHVRRDAIECGIELYQERGVNDIIRVAGRNAKQEFSDGKSADSLIHRSVGKIEGDFGAIFLRFAGFMVMNLHNQIGSFRNKAANAIRQ